MRASRKMTRLERAAVGWFRVALLHGTGSAELALAQGYLMDAAYSFAERVVARRVSRPAKGRRRKK